MFYGWIHFIQNLMGGSAGPSTTPILFVTVTNQPWTIVASQ